jgi:hypothetical protein
MARTKNMSHDYSEDQLVEQPTIRLFDDLGWETVLAGHIPQLAPLPSPN